MCGRKTEPHNRLPAFVIQQGKNIPDLGELLVHGIGSSAVEMSTIGVLREKLNSTAQKNKLKESEEWPSKQ